MYKPPTNQPLLTGTQTSKPKDDFDDYQPLGCVAATNTSPPQKHTTTGTQLSFDGDSGNEGGGTQTQTLTIGNHHANFSTQTNFDPKGRMVTF